MEQDNKRPNAALINREWYESAKGVLGAKDLSCVLVAAVEYVLYGDTAITLQGNAAVVFAMVKPALDSDIDRYLERCARNAANAKSQRQRVAASGTQSQPVAANTTTTPTPTTTSTTTTTPSISPEMSEEKERWLIYGYFWSTGSKVIAEECNAFWSYYESLGWRNNKGAAIVSKLACARMWKRQFETGAAPNGAEGWFKALQPCNIPNRYVFDCFLGAERTESGAVVRLRCKRTFYKSIVKEVPSLEATLKALWRTPEVSVECIS